MSNVSFGLPTRARKIINSVFLYHATKSGLDSVIINPKDIVAYTDISQEERKLAENLIFNLQNTALSDLISYYENEANTNQTKKRSNENSKLDIDPDWKFDKKCYYRIVNRLREGIEYDVVGAILDNVKDKDTKVELSSTQSSSSSSSSSSLLLNDDVIDLLSKEELHDAAVKTLNETLLPAMKEVGDKFGAGEIILPFVLKSAECMKAAVAELEKYLIKKKMFQKEKLYYVPCIW